MWESHAGGVNVTKPAITHSLGTNCKCASNYASGDDFYNLHFHNSELKFPQRWDIFSSICTLFLNCDSASKMLILPLFDSAIWH